MYTINEVIEKNIKGQYYGNRVILPVPVEVLKMVVDNEIIMDFSPRSKEAAIKERDEFTEIYLYDFEDLDDYVSKYEVIKMIVVERGKDIFNDENHERIALHLIGHHKLEVKRIDKNILFIE